MVKRFALAALLGTGCTIIGASAGAVTAETSGNGDRVGHDAKVGALIGACFDLAVIIYVIAVGSSQANRGTIN